MINNKTYYVNIFYMINIKNMKRYNLLLSMEYKTVKKLEADKTLDHAKARF